MYDTVLIGSQCWMAENLNVGTMVSGTTTMTNNPVIEKYCYQNLDSNCIQDGGLYQWEEAMQYTTVEGAQGICPAGWHIPAESDWQTLELTLGMDPVEVVTQGWRGLAQSLGTALLQGGSSGFEALYNGFIDPRVGIVFDKGTRFVAWSSYRFVFGDGTVSNNAHTRSLQTTRPLEVGKFSEWIIYGQTVRCVRD